MAEPRKAATDSCSFCGEHKMEVPLIVTSQLNTDCACCSDCALTIVHQTHKWAYGIFDMTVANKKKQMQSDQIITGGSVDDAIKSVS